jgi:hypothetical protein
MLVVDKMIISDLFGFLDYASQIKFDGGQVMPAANFDNACKWITKYKNKDGFIYPPLEHRVKFDKLNGKRGKKIPNTERPSLLHRLPPSHVLKLEVSVALINRGRCQFSQLNK